MANKLLFCIAACLIIAGYACNSKGSDSAQYESENLIVQANKDFADSNYTDALIKINEYIKRNPKDVDGYTVKGDILQITGDTTGAEQSYLAAYNISKSPETYMKLFTLFYNLDMQEKYCFYAHEAAKKFKSNSSAWNNLAICYWTSSDSVTAEKYLRKAIALDPQDALSIYNLATLYYEQGNYTDALVHITNCLKVDDTYSDAHLTKAFCFLQLGDTANGINSVNNCIEYDPENAGAHNLLGQVLYDKGEYEDAVLSFESAVEYDDQDPVYYFNLANACRMTDNRKDMLVAMKNAYALDTTDDYYRYEYGKALFENERYAESKTHFELLAGRYDDWAEPRNGMGNYYYASKNYDKAMEWYIRASHADPEAPASYYNMSLVYLEQKRYPMAVKYAKEALTRDPGNEEYNDHLTDLLKKQKGK